MASNLAQLQQNIKKAESQLVEMTKRKQLIDAEMSTLIQNLKQMKDTEANLQRHLNRPPLLPPRLPSLPTQLQRAPPAVRQIRKVRIVLARHGLSCSNVLNMKNMLLPPELKNQGSTVLDPPLTKVGKDTSILNGRHTMAALNDIGWFKEGVHLVGSSVMTRAIQTAHYMTMSWNNLATNIFPLPYFSENNGREMTPSSGLLEAVADGTPLKESEQQALLEKEGIKVSFKLARGPKRGSGANLIKSVLALPDLAAQISRILPDANPINMFIVGHGNVLTQLLTRSGGPSVQMLENNESLTWEFDIDVQTGEKVNEGVMKRLKVPRFQNAYSSRFEKYGDCDFSPSRRFQGRRQTQF